MRVSVSVPKWVNVSDALYMSLTVYLSHKGGGRGDNGGYNHYPSPDYNPPYLTSTAVISHYYRSNYTRQIISHQN